jgi:hypothetical protein
MKSVDPPGHDATRLQTVAALSPPQQRLQTVRLKIRAVAMRIQAPTAGNE